MFKNCPLGPLALHRIVLTRQLLSHSRVGSGVQAIGKISKSEMKIVELCIIIQWLDV